MKRINTGGLWAVVALFVLVISVVLFIYIDQRFGPETSAFLLGAVLGIPFLLIVVAIVGLIYILVIRGVTHMQERDDAGEIERMKAMRELARTNRSLSQSEKAQLDAELKQVRLLEAWKRQHPDGEDSAEGAVGPWQRSLPDHGWPDEESDDDDRATGSASYRILD
ncbi:MAG: hypothetical protein AAF702_28930 [Chloroflexota bacterium]